MNTRWEKHFWLRSVYNAQQRIAIIKKQLPAPAWKVPENDYGYVAICSCCGEYSAPDYCHHCGQRLVLEDD